jgi:hypothetical protein
MGDEIEGRPLLVPFWTRRSIYVSSQLCALQINTTSYLTTRSISAAMSASVESCL